MSEVAEALVGGEEGADFAERVDNGVEGSGADPAQVGLQLGEGHLDGVEVGAAGGQRQEP